MPINPVPFVQRFFPSLFPGQAPPREPAPGAAELTHLQAAGFSPQEVAQYQADTTQKLLKAGFTVKEIEAHWGGGDVHSPEIEAHTAANVQRSGATMAHGPLEAFQAGWGTSVVGLASTIAKGGDPNKNMEVQVEPGLLNSIANAAGMQAGDLAAGILGFVAGASAGAAVPGLGETGASEVVGGLAGGFGMGVASQGTREVLLDAYNAGQIHSVSDFLHVVGASTLRTLKAGVESAPFGLAGPIAGGVTKLGAGPVTSAVAGGTGATVLGVSTGAAIEGRMPNADDFVTAAAVMLVAHGVGKAGSVVKGVFVPSDAALHVQRNLEEIYRRNGTLPWDAIEQAKTDRGLRQELLQQDVNGNSVAPRTHEIAPQEPPPIKPAGEETSPGGHPMRNVTPKAKPPVKAKIVTTFEDLSTALEGSSDASVSPEGAIGKHQIMPGTARQYGFGQGMSQPDLIKWLHDPNNNAQVFHKIAADLHRRFHGDMNAMLIAYNAGPGRAGTYLTKGPGTMLEAIPDRKARGGIRYERVPAERDESWLPWETQKYLANGRRRSGGATTDSGAPAAPTGKELFPSPDRHAEREEDAGGAGGGKPPSGGEPPLLGGGSEGEMPRKPYSFDEATDEIMANVGEPTKDPSLWKPETLMTQYLSELVPARNIDNALIKAGELNRKTDVGQEDMFRQTYASDTRAGAFVRFGILKIGDNRIDVVEDSPSMMKAVEEIHKDGGNMRAWTAYMLARRTADKDKQGIDTGFNKEAAADMVTDPEAKKYARGTETFNKVMTGGLEYGRDSGLFSQKQIDAMVRDNPAYISMRRIMGDDASFGTGRGKGFVPREALKKMEGSDRSIVDPIAATIDNLRVIVTMADRNRAVGSIIGQVEAGKLKDLGFEKLAFHPEMEISGKPGAVFEPYKFVHEPGEMLPEETFAPLLAERSHGKLGPNEFIYYRDGVAERWSTKSPVLAALLRKTSNPGEVHLAGVIFQKIASLDRAGIMLSPDFVERVALINEINAFIMDPHHPAPFFTMFRGMYDAFTEKGVYKEWVANGGAGSALADMDVKWLKRDMEKTFNDTGVTSRIWNRVLHPIEAFQWVSERMDAASRIGYYKMATGKGLSPLKAGTQSRTAYLDFAEQAGLQAVNSLAKVSPFFRSKLLGTHQVMKAVGERPWETFAYLGFTVTGVSALLYAANYLYDQALPEGHDDEKFASIPQWIKDTHYVLPPIAGARIQIPHAPLVGPVFGGTTNRFLDYWQKSDPHAFDDWARNMVSDYNPFGIIPTALRTPLELETNYNFFTGHPIVPASVEAADGYMQYTNATTEPAKEIARWLGPNKTNLANVSPIQLEHLLRGWTGTVGMGLLKAVNGRMTDYQPPLQMADIPAVSTFFVRKPGMNAQQIEDFYTDRKAMEAAHADWALALKHADEGEMAMALNGPFYGLRTVSKITDALHVMSAVVANINKDTTLRPEEKSQATDEIVNTMIQLSVLGSGIIATLQDKDPGEAFKELDTNKTMTIAGAVTR